MPAQYDFSKCIFESKETRPLPRQISKMIKRALLSFGLDKDVIANVWKDVLPSKKLEREHFVYEDWKNGNKGERHDICCADAAAWTLYQTGVLPKLGMNESKIWNYLSLDVAKKIYENDQITEKQVSDYSSFHGAPYWTPWDGNKDVLKLVGRYAKGKAYPGPATQIEDVIRDGKLVRPAEWLPGDYFLYSDKGDDRHPAGQPNHIDVYLGDFKKVSGELPDGEPANQTYCFIEGSLGLTGWSIAVHPRCLNSILHYIESGMTVWHCRVIAIEQLYSSWKYCAPFDAPGTTTNPWRLYMSNESTESGVGGYYVVGLRRNLHGGIHLFPSEGNTGSAVRAMAPGYVVAARLPGVGTAPLAAGALQHLSAWPGFVILRHELQEVLKDPKAKPRSGVMYSLYMHLAPPKLVPPPSGSSDPKARTSIDLGDRYVTEVPWFRSLVERRYGAFVKVLDEPPPAEAAAGKKEKGKPLAPASMPLGKMLWSAEEVEKDKGCPTKATYKVLGDQPSSIEVFAGEGSSRKLRWLHKPSPADLITAVDALASGAVVTFGEPFFPVAAGDVLGFVEPLPKEIAPKPVKIPALVTNADGSQVERSFPVGSGFLHWQVFAPAKDDPTNGIALLVDLARHAADGVEADASLPPPKSPQFFEVTDEGDNNFLDLADIEGKLKEALPPEDGKAFADAFKDLDKSYPGEFGYAPAIISLLDGKTSFSPKPEKPDWVAGCKFGYPILLQIEPSFLPPPDKNAAANGKYVLGFQFEKRDHGKPSAVVCGANCDRAKCGGASAGAGAAAGAADTSKGHPCQPKPLEIDAAAFNDRKKKGKDLLTFVLRIPAEADRIRVKLGPGLVGEEGGAPKGSEFVLLCDALKERWRNVKMRQVNEWSIKSFKAIAKEIKDHHVVDDLALDLAWCDDKKETAIGRRVLAPGDGGLLDKVKDKLPLFSADGMIKVDGKLDNLHPVTAVWLLNLLDNYQKLTVADTWEVPPFRKEDPAPMAAAWVTPEGSAAPVVGDKIHAVVVDDDFGYDKNNTVKIVAESRGKKLEIAPAARAPDGNVVQEVTVCFWGDWTLDTDPNGRQTAEIFGQKKLTIAPIELDKPDNLSAAEKALAVNVPRKLSDGRFSWVVKATKSAREVEGIVSFQVRKAGGSWPGAAQRESIMLPATAVGLTAADKDEFKQDLENLDLLLLDNQKIFIVGVDEEKAKQKKVAKADVVVSEGLSYGEYDRAFTDIRLACSLIDALQTIAANLPNVALSVTRIEEDGLSMTVQPTYAKAKGSPALTTHPLLDEATKVAQAKGLTAEAAPVAATTAAKGPAPAAPADLILKATEGALRPLEDCPTLQTFARLLVTDPMRRYIFSCSGPQVTDGFTYAKLKGAYTAHGHIRLGVALAKALRCLRKRSGKVAVTHLAADGASVAVSSGNPKAATELAEKARASGVFSLVDVQGQLVILAAAPDPERTLVVTVDPAPIFRSLAGRGDIQAGEHLDYRFFFETLNGIHYLMQGTEGSCPFHDAPVDKAVFDKLAARSPDKTLTYGPSETAGRYSKIAFKRPLSFTWASVGGKPYLHVNIETLGMKEDWRDLKIRVSRKAGAGSFAAILGADKLDPPDEGVALHAALEVTKDKAFDGVIDFRVEAVPSGTGGSPPPLAIDGHYDCSPRWLKPKLVLDDASGTELTVSCGAAGVELPEFAVGHMMPIDVAREFEVQVTEVSPPAPAAGATTGAQRRPPTSPAVAVIYENPNASGTRGYLDATGRFTAYIPMSPRPGSLRDFRVKPSSLRPGGTYKIVVKRPKFPKQTEDLKVRNTPMWPLETQYYYQATCGTCPTSLDNFPYSDDTFKLVASIRDLVLSFSSKFGVPPVAVAGAIADEYNTRTGLKGGADWLQDNVLLNFMPNSWIEFDNMLDFDTKLLNATRHDIGKGNIKIATAMQVYDHYPTAFEKRGLSWSHLVDYLLTDAGTVHLAALVILQGQECLQEYLVGCPLEKREAILVTYYKQNVAKFLARFQGELKRDSTHRLQPGEGCRVCKQRTRFLNELGLTG